MTWRTSCAITQQVVTDSVPSYEGISAKHIIMVASPGHKCCQVNRWVGDNGGKDEKMKFQKRKNSKRQDMDGRMALSRGKEKVEKLKKSR